MATSRNLTSFTSWSWSVFGLHPNPRWILEVVSHQKVALVHSATFQAAGFSTQLTIFAPSTDPRPQKTWYGSLDIVPTSIATFPAFCHAIILSLLSFFSFPLFIPHFPCYLRPPPTCKSRVDVLTLDRGATRSHSFTPNQYQFPFHFSLPNLELPRLYGHRIASTHFRIHFHFHFHPPCNFKFLSFRVYFRDCNCDCDP